MESAIKFVAGINKWSKQYDYIFPLQTLIPFYEWNKIKKNSRNNLKVELGDITLSKKLVKQMEDFEYREEIIRCISDYKIAGGAILTRKRDRITTVIFVWRMKYVILLRQAVEY